MSVKKSQSGSRMLSVFEAVAAGQPIGASALARELGEDKSAVQRSLVTLAEAGWIAPTGDKPLRWEVTARMFTLAHLPSSSEELRARARPALDELRDASGETAFLVVPDASRFIVVEVAESRRVLRMAPRIGEVVTPDRTATGRAIMAHLDAAARAALLGREPSPQEEAEFAATARDGYAVSRGEVVPGATNLAAPLFDARGAPIAAIAIAGPTDRLDEQRIREVGAMLAQAVARLSPGRPRGAPATPGAVISG